VSVGDIVTAEQRSCVLPGGKPGLVVLARRTYAVDDAGRCTPAREQTGLVSEPTWDPEVPDLLLADMDLFHHKLRTDVIVHGHVYGDGRAGRVLASVGVGRSRKRLQVFGERRCTLGRTGALLFSEPAAIERVPLAWTRAYGGRDAVYEAEHGNPLRDDPDFREMTESELDAASPYLYPRNPCGTGYLIEATAAAVEALVLPQLENPDDLLGPGRLAVGRADQWVCMPLPQGTGGVAYTWYPRVAFLGVVPACERFDAPPAEVTLGLVPSELAAGDGTKPPGSEFELASGAALGLQLPHLRGGEPLRLDRVHPRQSSWRLTVPTAPALAIDGRKGKLVAVESVLHTLVIEPDRGRLTVVWRGHGPAMRRYGPDELAAMPMRAAWQD
jgi:hypothetical protein